MVVGVILMQTVQILMVVIIVLVTLVTMISMAMEHYAKIWTSVMKALLTVIHVMRLIPTAELYVSIQLVHLRALAR